MSHDGTMPLNLETLRKPTFVLKLVELILAIICIALASDSAISLEGKLATIFGTFIGFLILSCVIIAATFLETAPHPMLMLVVSAVAGIMFITAGAMCIDIYVDFEKVPNMTNVLVAGIMGLVAALVYAVDALLTYKFHAS